uniref:Uncharacterized protein n=1 Tax=Aegilops tauschii subsp. strangulata TaxID=200361 RepID=A0A453DTC7_AEGTS
MAVIASTLDSLLDLLSGFILWFTAHAMKKPNKYSYPIGKRRMQPVGHRGFCVGDGVPGVPGADRVGAGAGDAGAHHVRHLEGDVDGGQHVVRGRRQVLPHALLPDLQERDRPGLRAGPLLRRHHQLRRPRQRPPRRQVQVVDGPRRSHTDRAVHDHDVGADGAGERGHAHREVGAGRVPDQAHLPHLEPPRGDPAHRHGEGIHLRDALLRGGGRGAPRRHAAQPGARHRGGAAGEAGAAARGGARLRPRRLRVHAPPRAQGRRLISSCSSPQICIVSLYVISQGGPDEYGERMCVHALFFAMPFT